MRPRSLRALPTVILLSFSVIAELPVATPERPSQPFNSAAAEQDAEIDLLASHMLEKLKKANVKSVAVSRFVEEKKFGHRTFSADLTDDFTSVLASISGGLHVLDRTRISQVLLQKKWMSIDIDDSTVFRSAAFASGADAVIQGRFKLDGKFVDLSLKVVGSATDKKIADVKAKIPVPQIQDDSPDAPVQDPATGVYEPFVGGVTSPNCQSCPEPEFSPESLHIREAKSVFKVTVRSDGLPADIRLVEPAGYGLDESALKALQQWKFSPAHLPNGTPVSSRVTVEIAFHR